jgi:ABC-type transporter Mla subunit MlaD
LLVSLDAGLGTIEASLDTIDATISDVAGLSAATADLAATLPESFADIDAALATVESLGGVVDTTLGALSRVPFGPDYDPDVSFPEAIAGLRSSLDPIGEELGAISTELSGFAEGSGDLQTQFGQLGADLAETRSALGGTAALLDSYRSTAEDARALAVQGRSDLDSSMWWTRVVVVLTAILVIASQFVPWWLGSRLVELDERGGPREVGTT